MGLPRRFTIAESSHRILNPFTAERVVRLGEAIGLNRSSRILDLACGKGEALCLWAHEFGAGGKGVDIHPPFVEAATKRAAELGVSSFVRFIEADASGYVNDRPVDVAACLGATWIGGGTLGTLDLLGRSLKPGGIALVGDVYWRDMPTSEEALRACSAQSLQDVATLDGLVESVQQAGWDVVQLVVADEQAWDAYVAAQWLNLRRFIDEHPDDELVPELRRELDTSPLDHVRYQRRYLGWGVLGLMRR